MQQENTERGIAFVVRFNLFFLLFFRYSRKGHRGTRTMVYRSCKLFIFICVGV